MSLHSLSQGRRITFQGSRKFIDPYFSKRPEESILITCKNECLYISSIHIRFDASLSLSLSLSLFWYFTQIIPMSFVNVLAKTTGYYN